MNGGKKAKNPNDLIKEMFTKKSPKQSFEKGLQDIERLIELERQLQEKG